MSKPKIPTGSFGQPPAHAPHETSQPLTGEALESMKTKALANEKVLAPLNFGPPVTSGSTKPAPGSLPSPSPGVSGSAGSGQGPSLPPGSPVVSTELPSFISKYEEALAVAPVTAGVPLLAGAGAPGEATDEEPPKAGPSTGPSIEQEFNQPVNPGVYQPAASDSDSPSRGQPKAIEDPGKQITGGWGSPSTQYYALTGTELEAVVLGCMDRLRSRMAQDLRFGIAVCYPQVRVRVRLEVDGATAEAAINDIAFELPEARLVQLTALMEDTDSTPADALRDSLGLTKPFMRAVRLGAGKQLVDVA